MADLNGKAPPLPPPLGMGAPSLNYPSMPARGLASPLLESKAEKEERCSLAEMMERLEMEKLRLADKDRTIEAIRADQLTKEKAIVEL